MPNIYELEQGFNTLDMLITEELADDAAIIDAWENLKGDLAAKLENCCKYIKNQQALINGLKEEESRLKAKRQALENGVTRLKALMLNAQRASGEKKIVCGSFTTSIQKTGENVVIDEQYIENIPTEFLKFAAPEIDKKKIKEALQSGADLEGVAHLEATEYIKIY